MRAARTAQTPPVVRERALSQRASGKAASGPRMRVSRIRTVAPAHPSGAVDQVGRPGDPGPVPAYRARRAPRGRSPQGTGMAKASNRQRVIGAVIALLIVAAIGGTVAMRLYKKYADAGAV